MKIYQIHEYGGEWEDKYDCIVASYLSEERAIAEKERLEKENEEFIKQLEKCCECPLYNRFRYDIGNNDDIIKYCNNYEPFKEGIHNPDEYDDDLCINRICSSFYDNAYYCIEEVDVIE